MENTAHRAIAIVGVGAILPDAPNAPAFWNNVKTGRYSISDVTPERWDPALYYDPDPQAPEKTYSKIGGWVREFNWDPIKWRLPIPPRVVEGMDIAQRWAVACTREALEDYGYPTRPLNTERTAVILGNAMAGEKHYLTSFRIFFPEYARELDETPTFAALPESARREIKNQLHKRMDACFAPITEDTMPGELANCMAGRVANLYNFHGPNFVCDAACASAMAAISAAVKGLAANEFDVVVTGGVDRNMGAPTFVKFCKIGALSGTGTRPFAEGADGFVMGEGAAIFIMKRLADAERDQDRVYAVLRGVGGSSDGKGKGITAPNPIGQKLCVERGWENAGLDPATVTMIEGHGTSTRVGDVVETQNLTELLGGTNLPKRSVALGSVKSNIGHLKGGAGAAGILKTAFALRDKVLPPSLHCEHPSPDIDFAHSPIYVNTELKPWEMPADGVRRAGVSAFGFGGTNFHIVMEEHIPGRLNGNGKRSIAVSANLPSTTSMSPTTNAGGAPQAVLDGAAVPSAKVPLRGALVVGATSAAALIERVRIAQKEATAGKAPAPAVPKEEDLRAPERLAIDFATSADLAAKLSLAVKALELNQVPFWKSLRAKGIFRGSGAAPKVAFLYTGQGSQYVNMLQSMRSTEAIVADTFAEADRVMTPLLGKPLSEFIYIDTADPKAVEKAEGDLRQTAITQPAVLAVDHAMTRLLAAYGIKPDMTMGHSLGEYGALVASGALPFDEALEAVSARGKEMTRVAMDDLGRMAAIFAPLEEIERLLRTVNGYVVIANINSKHQAVIGGASEAVEKSIQLFLNAGYNAVPLPVSHAFHTSIIASAAEPLREMLQRLHLKPPRLPIVTNVTGEFYPTDPASVPEMVEILAKQIASPVQFVKGLQTLYGAGARVFVEVGPKKALHGFAEDVFDQQADVVPLFTNHPKLSDAEAFNAALCGLYAAGLGAGQKTEVVQEVTVCMQALKTEPQTPSTGDTRTSLTNQKTEKESAPTTEPVVITGAALGLPGTERIFDESNLERILRGDQFINPIPVRFREAMLDKHITRLVKSDNGGPTFETITDLSDVIKLAARGGEFDLQNEFGVSAERIAALDRSTMLAIGAGIDALRDAGLPLVMRYKTTTKGTQLPDRWGLPDSLRDDTGVIFAAAFPGLDAFADELGRYHNDRARREQLKALEELSTHVETNGRSTLVQEIDKTIEQLRATLQHAPYTFDRRFLFRALSMGHSQFAELIGARGPNTHLNAACASTTQAVAVAEDWIRAGRCRRVVVVSADDATSDNLMEWLGAGFLASGAAATDEVVEDAATPFDRRRHGMIVGMGAAALVVESAEAARERGLTPICEVLNAVTANSAFHGTRLNVEHITQVMEMLVSQAEKRNGFSRHDAAKQMVFVSHETYTPARGGSASAEIHALRRVFGEDADQIVIANTKGLTGHAMGTGIEDVVAVKALETSWVPPVVNFKEVDPELGNLNLSKGGTYPVQYALRLGAGFGSQISMTLLHWLSTADGVRRGPNDLGYGYRIADRSAWDAWLNKVTGRQSPDLEVVQHTLRVRDKAVKPADSLTISQTTSKPAAVTTHAVPELVAKPERKEVPAPQPLKIEVEVAPVATTPVAIEPDAIKERVLILVAEKTGYPKEMLDLSLDLEADLGIDTVKQAEMFAAIRESYGIQRDDKFKLREFPTLSHVVRFVMERTQITTAAANTPVPAVTVEARPKAKPEPMATQVHAAPAVPVVTPEIPTLDEVTQRILSLVADKTGYPQEMLDLDLDLEADLGIDTVKQAEMFAAIRESYGIARDDKIKLRDFPTLTHVVGFVMERLPKASEALNPPPPEVAPAVVPAATTPSAGDEIKRRILALVAEKTGYPEEMLDLDLDLEADLGIDTVKQAEMFAAIREIYNIPRDENLKLRDYPTLGHVIRFAHEKRPNLMAKAEPGVTHVKPVEAAEPAREPASATGTVVIAAPAAQVIDDEVIKEKVLAIVAEKTGYPKEMLDLDLDLEADLGVDTVKQAEMFASVRAAFDIPRDANLKLRDFPTLAHVIKFAHDRTSSSPEAPPATVEVTRPAPIEQHAAVTTEPVESQATPAVASAVDDDETIKNSVLEIVAEKTGYPKEMLDLDLDLEADLGIDTVKQAEMFASVRAAFNILRDTNLKLRDFPTLAHVIQFAHDRKPGVREVVPAAEVKATAALPAPPPVVETTRPTIASFDAANAIPRRVPVPVIRAPLAMCKETGADLQSGMRIVVMPDKGGVADILCDKLRGLGVEVLRIEGAPEANQLENILKNWQASGAIHGVFWLPALDDEGPLSGITAETWHECLRVRLKLFYTTMRTLYGSIDKHGTFLISATRLGGQHGYEPLGATAPMGGAATGFTKTYKRERSEALVKAVDFELHRAADDIADILLQETYRDPGVVEIGHEGNLRWTIGLQEQPATNNEPGLVLDKASVFVVTGAAGSIVSAITADLASASGGTFYLLDLVPEPDADNPDISRFVTDKDNLKRDLFARIQARGERATPALVEKELAALERAVAAKNAIDAVRNSGGTAHYISVNLTDTQAVARVIEQVRERSGRIDVLLHAAGIERSHFLPDKEQREFDLVFDVKADGWFNLLHAIGDMPLGATVAFSSIAGRFGNAGQTDYSSANDLLCKFTSSFRCTKPLTRGIVIDWTAWAGIGMATRGSIPKMMELAGIDMLPPDAGVPLIRRELVSGNTRGEIVVGQRLGVLLDEWDASSGIDSTAFAGSRGQQPMIGALTRMSVHEGLTIETTLNPTEQPFLYDHQIDNTPVLPGVMGIEAFCEAATCLAPGWHVQAVENVNFLAPFKFYRCEPRTLKVQLQIHPHGELLVADCRLIGERLLPNRPEPQKTIHFTARILLTPRLQKGTPVSALQQFEGHYVDSREIYKVYFHGPAYQVLNKVSIDGDSAIGRIASNLPNDHQPPAQPLIASPRLIEFCFQTAGVWEIGTLQRMGLPAHIDEVRFWRAPDSYEGLVAIAHRASTEESFDARVIDASGNRVLEIIGYRTVALPNTVSMEAFKAPQTTAA
jgi:acyl transferase domain-containing protein/NAD(P)-dependent dehydrogenase (short-subunit alcohol dehydrogenase family)/acyl carrier protein